MGNFIEERPRVRCQHVTWHNPRGRWTNERRSRAPLTRGSRQTGSGISRANTWGRTKTWHSKLKQLNENAVAVVRMRFLFLHRFSNSKFVITITCYDREIKRRKLARIKRLQESPFCTVHKQTSYRRTAWVIAWMERERTHAKNYILPNVHALPGMARISRVLFIIIHVAQLSSLGIT